MAEAIALTATLILMGAVLFAKIMTSQLVVRMKRQIATVDSEKQKILGQLKMIQSQKAVAERNRIGLDKKKQRVQKKVNRIRREMKDMKEDDEHRQKLRDVMRGKLARTPGSGEDEIE